MEGKNTTLRNRAEQLLNELRDDADTPMAEEINKLVHELQVHQIELELQNEELRQTHAKLEENRARYMQLYHHAPVGYVVLNQAGIITESNATFAKMAGAEIPQIDGKPFSDFLVPADQTIFRARLRSFFKQPADKHIELQLQSTGEIKRYVDLAATIQNRHDASEETQNELLVTVTDVTARVEAKKSLQKSQDFIVAIIDSLESHLCVLDKNGTILLVNKAWKRFAAENSSSPTDDLEEGANYLTACDNVQGEDRECARLVAAGIRAILRDEKDTFTFEYPCHSPREQRWFIGTATKLVSDTDYGNVVVAHHNITERKQLEKEQLYLHNQLKQTAKAESLGLMAGAIAHNFNNILAAVVGNLELALDMQQDGDDIYPTVKNALSAAWRASEISSIMLTYLGQTIPEKQRADFSSICTHNFQQIDQAKPIGTEIITDFPSPGPLVKVDSKQIRQVLSHLVFNAWEAMEDKPGNIHISICVVRSSEIGARFRFPLGWQPEDGNYACLTVADEGCGITDEDIEKIFDPFFTSKFPGRGMGLSVILGIIRSHDGAITVYSRIDEGTVFKVYIPVYSP